MAVGLICLTLGIVALLGHFDNHLVGVNELILRTSLTASQVVATISVLELKRLVCSLLGHQRVRT